MGLWEHCQIAEDVAVGVKGRTLSVPGERKKKKTKVEREKRLSHTVKAKEIRL